MPATKAAQKKAQARAAAAEGGSQRVANVAAADALAALEDAPGGAGQEVRQSSNGYFPPLTLQRAPSRAQPSDALRKQPEDYMGAAGPSGGVGAAQVCAAQWHGAIDAHPCSVSSPAFAGLAASSPP